MLQTNREMQRVQINKLIKGKQGTGVYNQEKMKIFFFLKFQAETGPKHKSKQKQTQISEKKPLWAFSAKHWFQNYCQHHNFVFPRTFPRDK